MKTSILSREVTLLLCHNLVQFRIILKVKMIYSLLITVGLIYLDKKNLGLVILLF